MAQVIKRWSASETADSNGEYVRIHGREGGLFSFLLSLVGVDPTTTLVVDGRSISCEQGSLAGFERSVTPISKIASATFGYAKPWKKAIVIGAICALILTPLPIIGWLLGGAIGLVYYFLNKELFLRIRDYGSGKFEIPFKRSVIEGQNIDERAGERIVAIIEMLMLGTDRPRAPVADKAQSTPAATLDRASDELTGLAERARSRAEAIGAQSKQFGELAVAKVAGSLAAASAGGSAQPDSPAPKCPGCGTAVTSSDAFCGGCGAKLR